MEDHRVTGKNMKRTLILLPGLLCILGATAYFNPDLRTRVMEMPADLGISKKTTRVYKWQNTDGQWQISDQLPPDGTEYDVLDYHEDLNVLPRPPALQGG